MEILPSALVVRVTSLFGWLELGRETKPTGNLSYLVVSCGAVLKDIRNVNTCALPPSESEDKQVTIGCHHLQVTVFQLIIPVDSSFPLPAQRIRISKRVPASRLCCEGRLAAFHN